MSAAKLPLVLGVDGLVEQLQSGDVLLTDQGVAQVINGILATGDPLDMTAQAQDTPDYVSIAGNPGGDFAGVDLLETLMDDASGLGIGVRVLNPPKLGPDGGLMLTDGKRIDISAAIGAALIIDTLGYQHIQLSTQAFTASLTYSNDLVNWSSGANMLNIAGAGPTTFVNPNTTYVIQCFARYARLVATVSGTAVAYLRTFPMNYANFLNNGNIVNSINIAQVGANSISSSQIPVAGAGAAGGSAAQATAGAPLLVSGADANSLKRTILTDSSGSLSVLAAGARLPLMPDTKTTNPLPAYTPPLPLIAVNPFEQDANGGELDTLRLIAQLLISIDLRLQQLPGRISASQSDNDDFTTIREDQTFLVN